MTLETDVLSVSEHATCHSLSSRSRLSQLPEIRASSEDSKKLPNTISTCTHLKSNSRYRVYSWGHCQCLATPPLAPGHAFRWRFGRQLCAIKHQHQGKPSLESSTYILAVILFCRDLKGLLSCELKNNAPFWVYNPDSGSQFQGNSTTLGKPSSFHFKGLKWWISHCILNFFPIINHAGFFSTIKNKQAINKKINLHCWYCQASFLSHRVSSCLFPLFWKAHSTDVFSTCLDWKSQHLGQWIKI